VRTRTHSITFSPSLSHTRTPTHTQHTGTRIHTPVCPPPPTHVHERTLSHSSTLSLTQGTYTISQSLFLSCPRSHINSYSSYSTSLPLLPAPQLLPLLHRCYNNYAILSPTPSYCHTTTTTTPATYCKQLTTTTPAPPHPLVRLISMNTALKTSVRSPPTTLG